MFKFMNLKENRSNRISKIEFLNDGCEAKNVIYADGNVCDIFGLCRII